MKLTPTLKKKVEKSLSKILDPELHISITELGLVYDVKEENGKIKIVMTLTTIGCPLFSIIKESVLEALGGLDIKEDDIDIELTFDPPWSIERISDNARASLGL